MRPARRHVSTLVAALSGGLVLVATVGTTPGQQSESFRMDRVSVSAGARSSMSPSFIMEPTVGQESPVGSVSRCNNGYMQSTGFWSVLGETAVPVRLRVRPGANDPTAVELEWSGSASTFVVYRAPLPGAVATPMNEQTVTTSCLATDFPPLAEPILYYLVQPGGN